MVQALLDGPLDEGNLWEAAAYILRIPLQGRDVVIAAQVPGPGRHALPQAEVALRRIGVISAWRLLHDAEVGIAWLPGPRPHLDRLADSLALGQPGPGRGQPVLRRSPAPRPESPVGQDRAAQRVRRAQRVTVFDRDLLAVAAGTDPEVMRHVSAASWPGSTRSGPPAARPARDPRRLA